MIPLQPLTGGQLAVLFVLGAVLCYSAYRMFGMVRSVATMFVGRPEPGARSTAFTPRVGKEDLYDGLVLLNVGALVGLLVALRIGRPRFFGMTLVAGFGVILFDVLILASVAMRGGSGALGTRRRSLPVWGLFLVVVGLVLVTIVTVLFLVDPALFPARLRAILDRAIGPQLLRWLPGGPPAQLSYSIKVGLLGGLALVVGGLLGGVFGYVYHGGPVDERSDRPGGGRPFPSPTTAVGALRSPRYGLFVRDRRFTVSALLGSIVVLGLHGRGLVYFLLVAVFFTSIVVHIYLTDRERGSIAGSLALLAVGAGLLVAAQALTVPYYVRTLDTVYHAALSSRITTVGRLAATEGTRYADLPIFHTLASIGVQLSGLAVRPLTGVLFAILFPAAVVAGFAAFRNVTGSATLGLLGAVLLAVNPAFISWGTQTHVQSLSFVFLAVFLLLLTKWVRDFRYTAAAGAVVLAWIMTHHLSVFMSVVLLSVPVVAGTAWVLAVDRDAWDVIQRPIRQYTMLTVAVPVYWWVTGLIQVPINWVTRYSPAASSGLSTEQFLIQVYGSPTELVLASVPFVINQLHYVFFMALAGYGLWTIIRPRGTLPNRTFALVVLSFLFAAPLYVPNPVWMVARGIAALNRWGIMTLLFLLLVPALALQRLWADTGRAENLRPIALLVMVLVFVSIGAGFTDPSLADSAGFEKGARKYLTSENLHAADHVKRYTTDTTVTTSHVFAGYLSYTSWTGTTDKPPERFETMTVGDGRLLTQSGLTVIQAGTLEEQAIKTRVRPDESGVYRGEIAILVPITAAEIDLGIERRNVVYTSADTIITFKQ